jgi:hypothetical protein
MTTGESCGVGDGRARQSFKHRNQRQRQYTRDEYSASAVRNSRLRADDMHEEGPTVTQLRAVVLQLTRCQWTGMKLRTREAECRHAQAA